MVGRHDEAIDDTERLLAAPRAVVRDDVAISIPAGVLADHITSAQPSPPTGRSTGGGPTAPPSSSA